MQNNDIVVFNTEGIPLDEVQFWKNSNVFVAAMSEKGDFAAICVDSDATSNANNIKDIKDIRAKYLVYYKENKLIGNEIIFTSLPEKIYYSEDTIYVVCSLSLLKYNTLTKQKMQICRNFDLFLPNGSKCIVTKDDELFCDGEYSEGGIDTVNAICDEWKQINSIDFNANKNVYVIGANKGIFIIKGFFDENHPGNFIPAVIVDRYPNNNIIDVKLSLDGEYIALFNSAFLKLYHIDSDKEVFSSWCDGAFKFIGAGDDTRLLFIRDKVGKIFNISLNAIGDTNISNARDIFYSETQIFSIDVEGLLTKQPNQKLNTLLPSSSIAPSPTILDKSELSNDEIKQSLILYVNECFNKQRTEINKLISNELEDMVNKIVDIRINEIVEKLKELMEKLKENLKTIERIHKIKISNT